MPRTLRVSCFNLTPLGLIQNVWFNTNNQSQSNRIWSPYQKDGKRDQGLQHIPLSTVKKHKKDYNGGNSPEAYDITRKIHKRHRDTHDHEIGARVHELVNMDPSKSMRAMSCELEVSVTLICKIVKNAF